MHCKAKGIGENWNNKLVEHQILETCMLLCTCQEIDGRDGNCSRFKVMVPTQCLHISRVRISPPCPAK